MKLLVQPGDGIAAIAKGIDAAKKSVEIAIFRLDRSAIEKSLKNAVGRGAYVRALIAHTNRSGGKNLRKLELRLLEAGVSVARTAGDLARYHNKLIIVDRQTLYLLAFNLTWLDIQHSRSFGIVTRNRTLVDEAVRLFEADSKRRRYKPGCDRFIVSPANARAQLAAFIRGAKKQLLIYDMKLSDPAMVRLLVDRVKAGVEVKIIGRVTQRGASLNVRSLKPLRLHTRTIVRDGSMAFIGSQSLRTLELDGRREAGIIFRDARAVRALIKTFETDWKSSGSCAALAKEPAALVEPLAAAKAAKKVAKVITEELPPVSPVLEKVVKEVGGDAARVTLDAEHVNETVKEAVKGAVKDAIKNVVEQAEDQRANKRA